MKKDRFNRDWITENSIEIVGQYEPGVLTIRGLHYRLVAAGMTNSITHYKRVVDAMIAARWNGVISFDAFSDHDREILGNTNFEKTDLEEQVRFAERQIQAWLTVYKKNRWENQIYYPEVFIEKKALQGVFSTVCEENEVALGACKGYPSLTFLRDAAARFKNSVELGKLPVILYFGDYDPSGEDIPRSIVENIKRLGCREISLVRIALKKSQVIEWKLPPAPVKEGDSRSVNWDGLGQVELDAVEPNQLRELCQDAIDEFFAPGRYEGLLQQETIEREQYQSRLKEFVQNL